MFHHQQDLKQQPMARERAPGRKVSKHARRSVDANDEADSNEVRLRSEEGNIFIVPKEAACLSMKIKRMVDDDKIQPFWFCISSKDLEKVIEFCKLPQNDTAHTAHIEFISKFDDVTLFNTMAAARDLDVKSLLDLTVSAKHIHIHTRSFITHRLPLQKHAVAHGLKAKTEEELNVWLQHLFIDDAGSTESAE